MYVEHNILVKDCAAKSMPEADRYLRIASRTPLDGYGDGVDVRGDFLNVASGWLGSVLEG